MVIELTDLAKAASTAVLRLCERRLKAGKPFMINANNLPKHQCYLEFPDQSIQLVSFDNSIDFKVIYTLSDEQKSALKQQMGIHSCPDSI